MFLEKINWERFYEALNVMKYLGIFVALIGVYFTIQKWRNKSKPQDGDS